MFDELMLGGRGELLRRTDGTLAARLRIRLPWYRSLPISCVEQLLFRIDGEPVDRDDLTIRLCDIAHTLDEAALLSDVSWFVLDEACAEFPVSDRLADGVHQVEITMKLRIPYTEPEYWNIDFTQTAKHVRRVDFDWRDAHGHA